MAVQFRHSIAAWLHCREEGNRCLFLRVDIVLHGATYVVVFTDTDQMPPPYRVDNFAEVFVDLHYFLVFCPVSYCLLVVVGIEGAAATQQQHQTATTTKTTTKTTVKF